MYTYMCVCVYTYVSAHTHILSHATNSTFYFFLLKVGHAHRHAHRLTHLFSPRPIPHPASFLFPSTDPLSPPYCCVCPIGQI